MSRGYPTNKYKMNGIFEFDQAVALAKAGCKVAFAAIDVRSIRRWRKWGLERHEIQGVNVYIINIPCGRLPKVIMHKIMSIGANIIYKVISKELGKPDILHAHFTDVGYVAAILKQHINVPLVITEHSSLINKPITDKRFFNTATKAYEKADIVLAVSPTLVNAIKDNLNVEAFYVPNIVDTDIFTYRFKKTN